MPRTLIPTNDIGQNSTYYVRGGTGQTALGTIKAIYTYPNQSSPNIPLRGGQVNPNYIFWVNVYSNNSSWGTLSITYPWSESSAAFVGNYQAYTGTYPYITIVATPVYGRFFNYWSAFYPSGPAVSYSSTYNIYYTDTFFDATIYANFY
jgi:hypothetical protein